MANMTGAERMQIERYDLGDARDRLKSISSRGQRVLAAATIFFVAVLGVLTYAAAQVFDGWHHLIVLADVAIVFFGIAAWVYPRRKHA
jgi:hypothetical protein